MNWERFDGGTASSSVKGSLKLRVASVYIHAYRQFPGLRQQLPLQTSYSEILCTKDFESLGFGVTRVLGISSSKI